MLVDDSGDFRILVALTVDDVAPVTPHRANIQEDPLVFGLCAGESSVPPLIPVDRLMRCGTQIRAGRVFETILYFRWHAKLVCSSSFAVLTLRDGVVREQPLV